MEDHARVLDFLPQGRPDDPRRRTDPVAYAVGEKDFVLLTLAPKPDATLLVGDRVYVGKDQDKRENIDRVRGRVEHEDMTHAAQSELPYVLEDIVKDQEERFLEFYNEAGPVTTRMHMLELLPGLGKKLMWAIIEERKQGNFTSFEDMDERVSALHGPEKLIAHRIETEITDPTQKYHVFARPPKDEDEGRGRRRGR